MPKSTPTSAVASILDDISKKQGLPVGSVNDVVKPVVGLTTGNLAIDYITGVGGIPQSRITELYGPPSCGKAQPLDALVLTPDGYVKMGELEIGQEVTDPAGGHSTVVGIYPQGVQPVYRLTFSDGSSAEATADHLWNVEVYATAFGFLPATVTTAQLAARVRSSAGRPRVRLVPVEPIVFHGREPGTPNRRYLPVHPYLLGLLLGDGTFDRAISFTTKDAELLDAVHALVPTGCDVRPASEKRPGITWRINGLASYIRDLGLGGLRSETKYVPELYKHQPAVDRLALLQGLMDTDGHATSGQYNAGHGVGEFTSASRQLRDDVVWLARSLGLKAVVGKTKKASYRNPAGESVPCHDSYRARIYQTEGMRVFRLARKLKPVRPGLHYNRELVSVEYVRDAECQCISVSADSKLYVTNDFIPTHNTTTALQAAAEYQRNLITGNVQEQYILYMDYEHTFDIDYATALGIDVDHRSFLLAQPRYLEQGADLALRLAATNCVRMVICDSVAAMAPRNIVEGDFGVRTAAMERARLVGDLCHRMVPLLHDNHCSMIMINHLMEAIDMGGRPGMPPRTTTPGGKGLKYYASLRLEYKPIKAVKGRTNDPLSNEVIDAAAAHLVKVTATKNKVGIPSRSAEVRIRYGAGFDNFWSALQVHLAHKNIAVGGGGYFYFDRGCPAHPDMDTSNTGRPTLRSEAGLLAFADTHPDWRQAVIDSAVTLIDTHGPDVLDTGAGATAPDADVWGTLPASLTLGSSDE